MLTVAPAAAATAIGRSWSASNKADVESGSSSSRGIFDNRTTHLHGNGDSHSTYYYVRNTCRMSNAMFSTCFELSKFMGISLYFTPGQHELKVKIFPCVLYSIPLTYYILYRYSLGD